MRKIVQKLVDRLHAVEDHLTVRTQIAAAVAVMCVVLVGTLAGCAALIGYQNTASQVNSNLAAVAAATSGRLDRFMAERQLEMKLFSQLQPLQKIWQNNPAELRHALEQLQSTFTDLAWIGFADVEGKVVAATVDCSRASRSQRGRGSRKACSGSPSAMCTRPCCWRSSWDSGRAASLIGSSTWRFR